VTSRATYGDVLRLGEFRALFVAHVVSMAGDVLNKVAVAVLVYQRTDSPILAAAAYAAGFLPTAVGAGALAALADSRPPRQIMIIGDCVRLACVLLMITPGMPVWALLALVFCSGAIASVFRGARQAILPDMLGHPDRYRLGRSLMSIAVNSSQIAGFGLGGLLLVAITPQAVLAIDAATFAFSGLVVVRWVKSRPAARQQSNHGTLRQTWEGNRAIVADTRLRRLLILQWAPVACAMAPTALAAPYAAHLGAGAVGVGLLMSAPACGMIPGDILVGRVLSARARQRLTPVLAASMCAPLITLAADPPLPVACVVFVVCGAASAYTLAVDQAFAEALPAHLRGQGMVLAGSGLMLCQGGLMALAGVAAEVLPPPLTAASAGLLGLVVLPWALRGKPWLDRSSGPREPDGQEHVEGPWPGSPVDVRKGR
jgi:hypothetical protein